MKRSDHHPEERSPKDQKDSETVKLGHCPQAAFKRSLKDDTGYQYRYTSVTRPLKGTAFLFIDKGGCWGIVMPRSLIFMSTHKATSARCLRSTAVRVTTLRRLALSVLFIIRSTRLLATRPLVPSPREPSIKGNTPMLDTELSLTHTPKHYDTDNLSKSATGFINPESTKILKLFDLREIC